MTAAEPQRIEDTALRVAVIGAGYFSSQHLSAWRSLPEVELVALADRDAERLGRQAARFEVAQVWSAVEPMLDDTRPDLLDVVVPPAAQRACVEAAAARGIDVICQKPFGTSYADAVAMTECAESAGITLAVHENFRWQPWYREARRLIDAGVLGRLHGAAFRLRPGDGQGPRAYLDRQPYFQAMPRLLVVETAIHFIDTFRYLLGEVGAVTARLRRLNPVIAGEDAGVLLLECGDALALFDGNRLNEHVAADARRTMGELWLEGSGGVLRLDGDARLWFKPHGAAEREHGYDAGPPDAFGGGACIALQRHVVRGLRRGTPIENTARAYLRNLAVQEAAYRSHADGRRIELAGFDPLERTVTATFPHPTALHT